MNKVKKMWFIGILMGLFVCAGVLCIFIIPEKKMECGNRNPLLGDWKVTRVVQGDYKSCRRKQYLGSEIGRCISITSDSISDSRTLDEAKQDPQVIYDFSYEKYDILEWDLTNEEKEHEFRVKYWWAPIDLGFSVDKMYEYRFYAKEESKRDIFYITDFEVLWFEQEGKEYLIQWFPGGYYILERVKCQKTTKIWGEWLIDYMVSEKEGVIRPNLDYIEEYGQVYTFMSRRVGINEQEFQASYTSHKVNRINFEKENHIREGLGVKNKKITLVEVECKERENLMVIPLNKQELLIYVQGRWYHAQKLQKSTPYEIADTYFLGVWKPVQLLYVENKNDQENWEGKPLQPYGDLYLFSVWDYVETNKCNASEMIEQMEIPVNIQKMLNVDDTYWTAWRYTKMWGERRKEQFIVLDEETMIVKREGLWYLLKRVPE